MYGKQSVGRLPMERRLCAALWRLPPPLLVLMGLFPLVRITVFGPRPGSLLPEASKPSLWKQKQICSQGEFGTRLPVDWKTRAFYSGAQE